MKIDLRGFRITPDVTRLVAAILGIAFLAWGGVQASRAGSARRAELRAARATLATFAEWRRRYRPAVAAESIAWRRTWLEMQDLGVTGDERLALTQAVARAAELAGLRDVRVSVESADTTGSDERLSTEGARRRSAPFGLSVECRGTLQAVIALLGNLPSSVAPTSISLVRQEGRGRHRVTLAVYELEFTNAPQSVWTPLERGAAGRVGVRGSGG